MYIILLNCHLGKIYIFLLTFMGVIVIVIYKLMYSLKMRIKLNISCEFRDFLLCNSNVCSKTAWK